MDIPEGFEEVIPEGFEEVNDPVAEDSPGMLDFLMGAPRKGQKKSMLSKQARSGIGLIEPIISLGTAGIGQAMLVPRLINNIRDPNYTPSSLGYLEDAQKESQEEYTYMPRTELGQTINEKVMAPLAKEVLIPMGGIGSSIVKGSSRLGSGGAAIPRKLPGEAPSPLPEASKLERLKKLLEAEDIPEGFEEVPISFWKERAEKMTAEAQAAEAAKGQEPLYVNRHGQALDAEALAKQDAAVVARNSEFEQAKADRLNQQMLNAGESSLPFRTSVEEIAAKQNEKIPQRDMFVEQDQIQKSFDPYQEAINKQRDLEQIDSQNTFPNKAAEIEKAYESRQKQLFDEEQQAQLDKVEDNLMKIEQELREAGYTPKGDGQGLKTRAFNRQSERGAVDLSLLDPAFEKIKELANGLKLKAWSDGVELHVTATKDGEFVGRTSMSPENWANPKSTDNLKANWTESKEPGLAKEMYKFVSELGNDIVPSKDRTVGGKAMWDSFERKGFASSGMIRRQRGAINLGSPEPKPGNKVSSLSQDSQEIVAAKAALAANRKKEAMGKIIGSNLDAYTTRIDTPEKVIAIAPESKDLGPTQAFKARTISPGMNAVAISSNNPLLRYTRDAIKQVVQQTELLTRQFVTGPDGFGNKMKKLSQEELNEVVGALQVMDRKQRDMSPDQLLNAGYNAKQIDLIQHVRKMDDAKYEIQKKVYGELGMEVPTKRQGHFAGNFSGDYVTKVFDKEGNIVGVIGTNTLWSNKRIQAQAKKKFPDITFDKTPMRRALGGSGAKLSRVDGYQEILGQLAKDDPRFAKIQEVIDAAIKERGDSLYGASLHNKAKKGIWGNEGNKFWEDRNTNTKQALKAFVDYWEEGIASHLNLPTEVKLKELMDNPALDHMPRAKEYVSDYINNFTGRSLGTTGDVLNKVLDTPFRLTGIGSSLPREAMNQFNKRSSQMTMGFVNIPFMLTQYLQVGQMGMPELLKIRDSLGLSPIKATEAFTKATADGIKLVTENTTGKKANVDALTREAYQYAQDNGLLTFSEFSNSRHIFQNKFSKGFDKVADDLPFIGRTDVEATTRPAVFFSAVNMLADSGMPKNQIFDTAYNLTQHAMINYNVAEKPLMYGKMGVLGQSAGALQTFKHAYLGQLGTLAKDAAKGRPGPLLAALVVLGVYSGVRGVPFYQEVDEMVKAITDKFFHKREGISDILLKNTPEWLDSGVLSTSTGVNMQSRLSAADVIPNSVGEALSPFGSYGIRTGKAVLDLATNRDALAAKNLAVQLAPSGTAKGLVEDALKVNEKGQTINKTGEVDYQRSEFDRNVRKYSGATSLQESLDKEKIYNQLTNQKSRQDRQKSITMKAERLIAQNTLTQEKMAELIKEYVKEKGDPQQLVNALVEYSKTRNQTTKQRLQGIPSGSLGSVNKYQNYNE